MTRDPRHTLRRILRSVPLAALLALAFATAAEARQETVRWTHALGDQVASFHIQVGTSPGTADLLNQPIGVPTPDAQGIYSYTVDVNTDETIYIRMTAVDSDDVHSLPSNTIERSVALGMPGQPVVQTP